MCVRERARGYVDKPSVTHRRRANGESSPAATRPHYTPTFGFCFFFFPADISMPDALFEFFFFPFCWGLFHFASLVGSEIAGDSAVKCRSGSCLTSNIMDSYNNHVREGTRNRSRMLEHFYRHFGSHVCLFTSVLEVR